MIEEKSIVDLVLRPGLSPTEFGTWIIDHYVRWKQTGTDQLHKVAAN
jgi:hypothetical protein